MWPNSLEKPGKLREWMWETPIGLSRTALCDLIRQKSPYPGDIALSSETHHPVPWGHPNVHVRAIAFVSREHKEEL